MKRQPKHTLPAIIASLRQQGFKPLIRDGRIVDWRRVTRKGILIRTIEVHDSGRVTVRSQRKETP